MIHVFDINFITWFNIYITRLKAAEQILAGLAAL